MCDIRTKCVNLHKEYSDVLQVPDNGNVLEEFVIRDVAKNLVVATEVYFIYIIILREIIEWANPSRYNSLMWCFLIRSYLQAMRL